MKGFFGRGLLASLLYFRGIPRALLTDFNEKNRPIPQVIVSPSRRLSAVKAILLK